MKIKKKKYFAQLCALFLLSFANLISYSGSLLLHGEPKAPRSLIK